MNKTDSNPSNLQAQFDKLNLEHEELKKEYKILQKSKEDIIKQINEVNNLFPQPKETSITSRYSKNKSYTTQRNNNILDPLLILEQIKENVNNLKKNYQDLNLDYRDLDKEKTQLTNEYKKLQKSKEDIIKQINEVNNLFPQPEETSTKYKYSRYKSYTTQINNNISDPLLILEQIKKNVNNLQTNYQDLNFNYKYLDKEKTYLTTEYKKLQKSNEDIIKQIKEINYLFPQPKEISTNSECPTTEPYPKQTNNNKSDPLLILEQIKENIINLQTNYQDLNHKDLDNEKTQLTTEYKILQKSNEDIIKQINEINNLFPQPKETSTACKYSKNKSYTTQTNNNKSDPLLILEQIKENINNLQTNYQDLNFNYKDLDKEKTQLTYEYKKLQKSNEDIIRQINEVNNLFPQPKETSTACKYSKNKSYTTRTNNYKSDPLLILKQIKEKTNDLNNFKSKTIADTNEIKKEIISFKFCINHIYGNMNNLNKDNNDTFNDSLTILESTQTSKQLTEIFDHIIEFNKEINAFKYSVNHINTNINKSDKVNDQTFDNNLAILKSTEASDSLTNIFDNIIELNKEINAFKYCVEYIHKNMCKNTKIDDQDYFNELKILQSKQVQSTNQLSEIFANNLKLNQIIDAFQYSVKHIHQNMKSIDQDKNYEYEEKIKELNSQLGNKFGQSLNEINENNQQLNLAKNKMESHIKFILEKLSQVCIIHLNVNQFRRCHKDFILSILTNQELACDQLDSRSYPSTCRIDDYFLRISDVQNIIYDIINEENFDAIEKQFFKDDNIIINYRIKKIEKKDSKLESDKETKEKYKAVDDKIINLSRENRNLKKIVDSQKEIIAKQSQLAKIEIEKEIRRIRQIQNE